MAQNVFFKKGLLANLPASYAAGTFYVTTDEKAMYLDIDDSTRIRLGDFQEFATLDALKANANPSTTALYYVSELNAMAKWTGTEYKQINVDTGATSIEVVGEGNAVTAASYDATTRKLTLTMGETFATKLEHDTLAEYVGTIPDTAEATDIVGYIQEKTSGIATSDNLEELTGRVDDAEDDIDALQIAIAEGGSVANAIAEAKKAGTDAAAIANAKTTMADVEAKGYQTAEQVQAIADGKDVAINTAQEKANEAYNLANGKATMAEVNDAIAGAGHAVKSEVDAALAEKADKSVVDAMYTNKQIDDLVQAAKDYADANDADTKYGIVYDSDNKKIKLVEGGTEVEIDASAFIKDGMISNVTIGTDNDLVITFNTDAGKENIILPLDQLVDIYTGTEGARVKVTVASDKSISADLVAGSISKNYLDEGVQASLAKADNAEANAKAHTDAEIVKLTQADATNLQTAKDYADDAVEALGIGDYIKKADADAAYATANHNHDAKYDAIGSATAAQAAAEAYADGLADNYDAAGSAEAAQAAAEATAASALATARTEITAEIDADVKALADGAVATNATGIARLTEMLTWGSF